VGVTVSGETEFLPLTSLTRTFRIEPSKPTCTWCLGLIKLVPTAAQILLHLIYYRLLWAVLMSFITIQCINLQFRWIIEGWLLVYAFLHYQDYMSFMWWHILCLNKLQYLRTGLYVFLRSTCVDNGNCLFYVDVNRNSYQICDLSCCIFGCHWTWGELQNYDLCRPMLASTEIPTKVMIYHAIVWAIIEHKRWVTSCSLTPYDFHTSNGLW